MCAQETNIATRINDNLEMCEGVIRCVHCSEVIGTDHQNPTANALFRERRPEDAGPHIRIRPTADATPIVMRQWLCPNCLVCLQTEIVPQHDGFHRGLTV